MNGLLVTTEPFEAFTALGSRARYAGMTADGRGIVAVDDINAGQWDMRAWGTFYAEADPDWPDSWPDWARPSRGPKRKVADGSEAFIIYTLTDYPKEAELIGATLRSFNVEAFGLYDGPDGQVMIAETYKWRPEDSRFADVFRIEEWQDRRVDALEPV